MCQGGAVGAVPAHFDVVVLREAVAEAINNEGEIDAVRARLHTVFSHFTLHNLGLPSPTSPSYWQPELLVAGHGGLYLEPHPRPEFIADADKSVTFPVLHRVSLSHAANNQTLTHARPSAAPGSTGWTSAPIRATRRPPWE